MTGVWPPPPPAADPAEGEPLTRSTVVLHVASNVRMSVQAALPSVGGGFVELGTTGNGLRMHVLDRDAARRLHEATGLLLTEIDNQLRRVGGHQHLTAVSDA